MKKIDIVVLVIIVMLAIVLPISLVVMQNNRENFIMARTPENGNWSVSEIKVKLGSSLELKIVSDDVSHSFTIKELNIDVFLYPGRTVTVIIDATQLGEFYFQCFVYCSPNHTDMFGKLIVYK